MAVAAAVLSLPNLFFGFADAPAAKAMTRARAVVPARIFLNIMTSSPLWGRSPDADARMSRHGNAAQGAVEVARGDVQDRKSVGKGKRVSVRVELGGGRIQKK